MLEPRRLAARGAAERMAATLSEKVGQLLAIVYAGIQKQATQRRSRLLPKVFLHV